MRRHRSGVGYLIAASLFWLAPFYGILYGPWLLGQGVALACNGIPLASVILAAAGMLIAAKAGRSSARWLWG